MICTIVVPLVNAFDTNIDIECEVYPNVVYIILPISHNTCNPYDISVVFFTIKVCIISSTI